MKILAVDDHPLIQAALCQVLRELAQDTELVCAGDRDEALRCADEHPDCALILLDLSLPGASGMSLLAELRERHCHIPVVVLSATFDRATVLAAVELGAMGFIPKTFSSKALLDALRQVLLGEVCLPAGFADYNGASAMRLHDDFAAHELGLSPRQMQVLTLIVQGMPNKLICRSLNLAEGTVKVHVSAVLRALNVDNRTQAVIAMSRMGLRLDPLASARATC